MSRQSGPYQSLQFARSVHNANGESLGGLLRLKPSPQQLPPVLPLVIATRVEFESKF
jgi:hypothetical protein